MIKTIAAALLLAAPVAAAQTIRIRVDGIRVMIAGGDVAPPRSSDIVATPGVLTVPRSAAIELTATGRVTVDVRDVASLRIDAAAGTITAERIAGNIDAKTANGNVAARDIGGNFVATTGNGNMTVDGARGLVDITTGNGKNDVAHVAGGVHVTSISAQTSIRCAGGSVSVNDTSGRTDVASAGGDVELFTALGQARYSGALQPAHAYRLRTLDGAVTLEAASGGSGFTALLSSDAQKIEGDLVPPNRARRLSLRNGDERARVVLDAVGGRVALQRAAAVSACR